VRPHRVLFAAERQDLLLRKLSDLGRIDAAALATEVGVSNESIRKDLALLEERGLLRRVHGGAILPHELRSEPEISARTSFAAEKQAIAVAALQFVPPNGSILLDAGSTTARLAALLPMDSALFVATNSLPIASALTELSGVTVQSLGGTVRRQSGAGVGPLTVHALASINVDVAFLGANAVSLTRGLSTPDEQEGMTKTAMLGAARRRILLADHSKFGRESLYRYADLADVDILVTDAGISDEAAAAVSAAGVDITLARKAA
jgi:DeoR family fructose operon transcriptional repressor